jgi:pilus assembly protein CpaE
MSGDMTAFRTLTREIAAVSPETVLIGMYRPDVLSGDSWDANATGGIFVEAIRAGVRDVLRRPISRGDLAQVFQRLGNENNSAGTRPSSKLGKTVCFISNKGGVGKSTSAVNSAVALARRYPRRVLLVDASLQMGVCASMLDLTPSTTLIDAVRESERLDETLVRQIAVPHSSGLDLLAAPPDAIAATEIDDEILSRILNLARRAYDFVIIDTFPLFDRIVIAILDLSDLTYIVLDNTVPTILSVASLTQLLDGLDYSSARQRIVVNRFSRKASCPSIDDVSSRINRPVDHILPFHKRAIAAVNTGDPFALHPRFLSSLDRGLNGIVDEIESVGREELSTAALDDGNVRKDASVGGDAKKLVDFADQRSAPVSMLSESAAPLTTGFASQADVTGESNGDQPNKQASVGSPSADSHWDSRYDS